MQIYNQKIFWFFFIWTNHHVQYDRTTSLHTLLQYSYTGDLQLVLQLLKPYVILTLEHST